MSKEINNWNERSYSTFFSAGAVTDTMSFLRRQELREEF
jgi:hypothetical protein